MKPTRILEIHNPDALLLEPREVFDRCLVGVVQADHSDDHWPRTGHTHLIAVYDRTLCIEALVEDGLDPEDAYEHFEFNVQGGWMGPHTPTFEDTLEAE